MTSPPMAITGRPPCPRRQGWHGHWSLAGRLAGGEGGVVAGGRAPVRVAFVEVDRRVQGQADAPGQRDLAEEGARLGFGRIVASDILLPKMLVNLV
jgi:hypothetical protein